MSVRCSAERCGTGVPPGRPFCTRHMMALPYRITKDLWGAYRDEAISRGIAYLRDVESGATTPEKSDVPGYKF